MHTCEDDKERGASCALPHEGGVARVVAHAAEGDNLLEVLIHHRAEDPRLAKHREDFAKEGGLDIRG